MIIFGQFRVIFTKFPQNGKQYKRKDFNSYEYILLNEFNALDKKHSLIENKWNFVLVSFKFF